MDSMVDSLFDQYERGRMTRRHLVQALAALVLPTNTLAQTPPGLPLQSFAACPSTTSRSRSAIFHVPSLFMNDCSGSQKAGRRRTPGLASTWICLTGISASIQSPKGKASSRTSPSQSTTWIRTLRNASPTRSTASCRPPKREMRIRRTPRDRRSISGIPTACSCKSRRKTGADQASGGQIHARIPFHLRWGPTCRRADRRAEVRRQNDKPQFNRDRGEPPRTVEMRPFFGPPRALLP